MKIDSSLGNIVVQQEISRRFKQYRIAYPMTQADLAEKSMVSLSTIRRFENGGDISLSKLILLMEALDIKSHLEVLVADQTQRPSAFLLPKPRQRVRKKKEIKREWKWGDER